MCLGSADSPKNQSKSVLITVLIGVVVSSLVSTLIAVKMRYRALICI